MLSLFYIILYTFMNTWDRLGDENSQDVSEGMETCG
jgi:hypothetical protein